MLGDNQPKEVFESDAKDALEGVQANIVLTTLLEDDS